MLKYKKKNSMWFDSPCKIIYIQWFCGPTLPAGTPRGGMGSGLSGQSFIRSVLMAGRAVSWHRPTDLFVKHGPLGAPNSDPTRRLVLVSSPAHQFRWPMPFFFYEFLTRTVWLSSPAIGYRCTNPKYWQKKVSVVLQRPLLAVIPGEIGHCRKTREGEEAKNPPNKI